jgi:hypothetical protein
MEILLSLVLFLAFFGAMALGLIFRGKSLQGSCGGAAALMGEKECGVCNRDPNTCERKQGEQKVVAVRHRSKAS